MKPFQYKVDQQKWQQFTPSLQLQHIAAEVARATHAALREGKEEREWTQSAYERALALIEASIIDNQWKEKEILYSLRDAISALYLGKVDPAIGRFIYLQLLQKVEK